jgi:hypothetical protein
VDDEGTPVLVRLAAEWDQVVGKKTAKGTKTLDLTFDNVGSAVAITAPDEIWEWSTSKRYRYTMGYPEDWQYERGSEKYADAYWGYDGDVVFASRTKSYGFSLNQVATIVTKNAKDFSGMTGVKITSNKPGKLGSLPARIVQYSGKVKKTRYWYVLYIAVKSGYIHWVELRTDGKTTSEDRALAADFAATFTAK